MTLPKIYNALENEAFYQKAWEKKGSFTFSAEDHQPVYSIDTPPPTLSGNLHIGHIYSYVQPDIIARFKRMQGYAVFYPFGVDDNGLPTEHLMEKLIDKTVREKDPIAFQREFDLLKDTHAAAYERLFKKLGLSMNFDLKYRTLDSHCQRISQLSFLFLLNKKIAYRKNAPVVHCPKCQTAVAQAELDDISEKSSYHHIAFPFASKDNNEGKRYIKIATTRPELIPAVVAVFVNPEDSRYAPFLGKELMVPLFNRSVPILGDALVDPEKGTGAVMCATFGDQTDVHWWKKHDLPLKSVLDEKGKLNSLAGPLKGLSIKKGREKILGLLVEKEALLASTLCEHIVPIHDRCDTKIEYRITPQWFIRTTQYKDEMIKACDSITFYPAHMKERLIHWIESLSYDWCISRQRSYGIYFPIWTCNACKQIIPAEATLLPINPMKSKPSAPCTCGSESFTPEKDVLDTWATSSLTPRITRSLLGNNKIKDKISPMSIRPQGHDIIRTWTYYTILRSILEEGKIPFSNVIISGWGLAPKDKHQGRASQKPAKISKSRNGNQYHAETMLEKHSADLLRYWSASGGFGKDLMWDEKKIKEGQKLLQKLWNVARFTLPFIKDAPYPTDDSKKAPADEWILWRLKSLIQRTTHCYDHYDIATALTLTERFFYDDFADNYLEMIKKRLYGKAPWGKSGAIFTLYTTFFSILKIISPIIPHITETIHHHLFSKTSGTPFIHQAAFPDSLKIKDNKKSEETGTLLVLIASTLRKYRSDQNMSMRKKLNGLILIPKTACVEKILLDSLTDIESVTCFEDAALAQIENQSVLNVFSNAALTIQVNA